MWIARKEIKALADQVKRLYNGAAASGDRVLLTAFQPPDEKAFREFLSAHMELREQLASLLGRLEGMATR